MRDVDGLTGAAFVGVAVIGGANYVAVKVTVGELEPLYGATIRFGGAAVLFLALLVLARVRLPTGAALVGALLYGGLGFGVAYACMYFALVELSAGTASMLAASVPVLTLGLAALHRMEAITARGLAGGLLVIVGVAVLSLGAIDGEAPLAHLVAAIVAPVAIAEATVVAKRFPRTDPIATNAVGMLAGALLLVPASLLVGETWALPRQTDTWVATAWIVVVGSVGMFWLVLFVMQRWTASATSYVLPLMPVVAVALGALLEGEAVGAAKLAGGALVIGGAYLGTLRVARRGVEPAPEVPVRSS